MIPDIGSIKQSETAEMKNFKIGAGSGDIDLEYLYTFNDD